MRQLAVTPVVLGLCSCGDEESGMDMALADLAMPDLTVGDLTLPPDFAGVSCGTMTCGASQECCASLNGMAIDTQCVAKGSCNGDAGAVIACDGPEDCPGLSG